MEFIKDRKEMTAMKRERTFALVAAILLLATAWLAGGSAPAQAAQVAKAKAPAQTFVVYYFHGRFR